ncbi:hypothetical protein KPL70_022836 [Citrus sinensis]|nr:hypothetical protein KPL70_022836 [Citrus sinensis]
MKLPNKPNQNQKAVKFHISDEEDLSDFDDDFFDDDEYDEYHPPLNKIKKPIMGNGGRPGMMPNNMTMMNGNHPRLMNAQNGAPNAAQNDKKGGNNNNNKNNQPKGGGGGQQPNPQQQLLQQLQQMKGFQELKLPPHFKDLKLPNMPIQNQNQKAVKFSIPDDDEDFSGFDDDESDDEDDEYHPPPNKMKPITGNVGPPRMTPNNMMTMMNGNHPQLMDAQNCAPNAAQNAKKGKNNNNNNNNQPRGGGGGQHQNPQQQLQQMKGDFDDEFFDDDEYDEHHPPLDEMKPIMGSGGPPGTMPNNIMMNGNRPQLLLHGFGDDDLRLTFSPAALMAPAACQVNEQYQWQNIKVYQLLGKHKKRSLAVFYLVLEAASFLLDLYGKSERALLLAAFLLSAFGFAMCMYTCIMGRSRGSTSVQIQKQLVRTVEIAFSVVQLIVTLVYFILAEIHVKNNFSVSVFPLLFAVIIAVFTFKNDGGASDSSGHADDDLFGDPPV